MQSLVNMSSNNTSSVPLQENNQTVTDVVNETVNEVLDKALKQVSEEISRQTQPFTPSQANVSNLPNLSKSLSNLPTIHTPTFKKVNKSSGKARKNKKVNTAINKPKRAKNPIIKLTDDDKSKISISELKAKCRELGIKGYSKKTKDELMDLLLQSFNDNAEVQKISLLVKNVQHLKKICRELGVRGYSKKKKTELVDIICEERDHKHKIESAIDDFLQNKPIPDYLLTKTIMMNCYRYIESKKLNISLEDAVQCILDDYSQIKRDIIKLLCKKIKKKTVGENVENKQDVQQTTNTTNNTNNNASNNTKNKQNSHEKNNQQSNQSDKK